MTDLPAKTSPGLFEREALFDQLVRRGAGAWVDSLREQTRRALDPAQHGSLPGWIAAWHQLPEIAVTDFDASGDAVEIHGQPTAEQRATLNSALRAFHPWRKGPFRVFDLFIDTEWRSDLKWNRFASHIDLRNRAVLDVGCGNGYYGWRMLAAGAALVVGLDPFLLYLMQFETVRRYAGSNLLHGVLPLSDNDLPPRLELFDVTFSMGVLYHRTSPIEHLQSLWGTLRPGGTLVLETLILNGDQATVLVPEDRYAQMRNVWFIPTLPMLQLWLRRTGFRDVRVVDVTPTTAAEQRKTDWMTFDSLPDFLDPADPNRTIEGYPGPVRAVVMAERR